MSGNKAKGDCKTKRHSKEKDVLNGITKPAIVKSIQALGETKKSSPKVV